MENSIIFNIVMTLVLGLAIIAIIACYKGTTKSLRSEVFDIIGRDQHNADYIDILVYNTVVAAENPKQDKEVKVLCSNNISTADALFFASFFIRAFCICGKSKPWSVMNDSNRYVESILKIAVHKYKIDSDIVATMFYNRMAFYDSIYTSDKTLEDKISSLSAEFEFIIMQDYCGEYKPFDATSPLTILGLDKQIAAQIEAGAYVTFIFKLIKEMHK